MAEGATKHGPDFVRMTTANALTSGQVVQAPGGKAAVYAGLRAAEAGDYVTLHTAGVRNVAKTASINFLPGQEVWWSVANNSATYKLAGDFFVGIAPDGAAGSASVVACDMNCKPSNTLDTALRSGEWTTGATNGLGVVEAPGGRLTLAFDAVAEVGMAAIYSTRAVDVDNGLIFELEGAVYDIGDDAALDINFGLASGTHATDFDAVTACAAFHLDGSDLTFKTQSDDNVNAVSADDSGVDAVDDTMFFAQIDARDKDDIKFYVNGVQLNDTATFHMTAYTGTLVPIVHLEKTSNDTVADFRVQRMTLRSATPA